MGEQALARGPFLLRNGLKGPDAAWTSIRRLARTVGCRGMRIVRPAAWDALWAIVASACRKSALLLVGGLLPLTGSASDPVADRTCVMFDTGLVCASVFEADLLLDSQPVPLTQPAGQGFVRAGYKDSTTGAFVEVFGVHYTDRFLTSYPQPRTLLLVPNPEWISSGGFEGEYAHPMR